MTIPVCAHFDAPTIAFQAHPKELRRETRRFLSKRCVFRRAKNDTMNIALQVKPSDCDQFGHVNNAVPISYVQYALADIMRQRGDVSDWEYESPFYWDLRQCSIEYRHAAAFGDTLTIRLGLTEADPLRPVFDCDITRSNAALHIADESVVRTRSVWQRVERATGEAKEIPPEMLAYFPRSVGETPRAFALPKDQPHIRQYAWEHQVMRVELDPSGHIRPQAAYNWLEECIFLASAEAGWTPERRMATGFLIFQMRHDTEYRAFPRFGEAVRIISRLVDVRRFRGTWIQDIYSLSRDQLLIRDYSTGIFVDASGHPATPPQEMMTDIQGAPQS